jgi:RNA polymerase sigma-70 factor (ECF subfamily)
LKNSISNDVDLWNKFREGDQQVFGEIYELYYNSLYSYGRKFFQDASLIDDAIQELFITLWRTKSNLSEVTNIKFYLFRCLRRLVHNEQLKQEKVNLASFEYLAFPENDHSVQSFYEPDLLSEKLKIILKNLPARQLEAITLRYYENFSNQEIAEIMNISEKTVRNTLHNALSQLRENLPYLNPLLQLTLFFQFSLSI